MRSIATAVLVAAVFFAHALAATPRVLQAGDKIDLVNGETFTVPELRSALREYGYFAFAQGDHFGRIIKITAFGPDKRPYRLKVRSTTGEVTHARRLHHLF